MKLVHSILAVTGLAVIVGFVVWAQAESWRSELVLLIVAAIAGFVTRLLVPRDRRARLLERLNR